MEKLMQKENVYRGSGSEESSSDFKDVFGGPPRRFSMQEVRERYSFGESSSEEMPVFGEERRRRKGADFFDDIFKGSPRSRDRDRDRDSSVFGSSPGSMIMSPARPFSPKPLPLPPFLPASFSLPAKSSMGMDLPTFGSNNNGQHKVDGDSNELSNSYSWSSFSRFSNEASRSLDDVIKNEVQPVRPLSEEAEDSPFNAIISDKEEIIENSNKDTRNVDSIGNQFHFSIYKWEGIGVPMLMPHVIGKNLKSKDSMKLEKSCSSNGRMESRSSSVRNQERAKGENKQEQNYVAEAFYELSESRSKSRPNDSAAFNTSVKENRVKLADGSNAGEKMEKEVPVKIIEETKDKKARNPEGVRGDARDSKKVKEKGSKGPDLSNAKVEKPNLQGAVTNLGEADGKSAAAATRKVKEFVHIFNQETDSKPKADAIGSRRRGNVDIDKKGNEEVSSNQEKVKEQVNLHNVEKKLDVSFKVVEDLKNNEAQRISPKRISSSSRSSSRLRKPFSAGKLLEDLLMSQENLDDPLEDNFEVHELSDGNENVSQNESSEDTKAIDAKIRQWSVGKKGNIRSLLSTLQYVLWAESGWKAVPLVDLIETNSVKRAYQKALLRLHPDKLQQKGADFQHKYIAEKVFDILQEAWDHFNACSSLGI